MFKKLRGIDLSYERQGFTRFTCLTYEEQPQDVKDRILNLCIRCGADKYQALFEFMTTQNSAVYVAGKHYISESSLYNIRRKFYYAWWGQNAVTPKKLPQIGNG